jgi:hypothetical protein
LATSYKLFQNLSRVVTFFGKTTEQGAATSVYCATNPALNNVTGRYYVDCSDGGDTKRLEHAMARDEQLQDALWNYSIKLIDSIDAKNTETMHF